MSSGLRRCLTCQRVGCTDLFLISDLLHKNVPVTLRESQAYIDIEAYAATIS